MSEDKPSWRQDDEEDEEEDVDDTVSIKQGEMHLNATDIFVELHTTKRCGAVRHRDQSFYVETTTVIGIKESRY